MKLKNKFLIYSVIIHLIFIFFVFQLFRTNLYLFITGEVLICISLLVSGWMYQGISRPFSLISLGVESIKDHDFNSRLLKTGHQEMDELIDVYNKMIDQLREDRIKQAEKNYFLDRLIQASPSGIIMLDPTDQVRSMNMAARRMLGITPHSPTMNLKNLAGKLAHELSLLKDGVSEVITINGVEIYKCQKAHFVNQGYSHYFIVIEELTNEIYKKEKSAYEKVIRMMSHETNNSIGAINSILNTFISYKKQLDPAYRDDYENALTVAVNRNKALSDVMSNFAKVVKIPEPVKEEASLHVLLRSVQVLMDAESKKKQLEWEWQLSKHDHNVVMDVQQMEQVLINIFKNAIEATEDGGRIILSTSDNPVSLSIRDNGTGISEEVSGKLFSPFFSTKKNGQGVGLTIIREILLNHGFKFSLDSQDGWTEFRIYF